MMFQIKQILYCERNNNDDESSCINIIFLIDTIIYILMVEIHTN
uniref:Uncharacterized protein n=1 Tax=Arundo donax TaxID=35708 RepID=A0A0A9BDR9_ARUDO